MAVDPKTGNIISTGDKSAESVHADASVEGANPGSEGPKVAVDTSKLVDEEGNPTGQLGIETSGPIDPNAVNVAGVTKDNVSGPVSSGNDGGTSTGDPNDPFAATPGAAISPQRKSLADRIKANLSNQENKNPDTGIGEGRQANEGDRTPSAQGNLPVDDRGSNQTLRLNQDIQRDNVEGQMGASANRPEQLPSQVNPAPGEVEAARDSADTSSNQPDRKAHYVAGNRVMLTEQEFSDYQAKLEEVNKILDGRPLGDVPLSDPYYGKVGEIERMVAGMRR